MKTSRKSPIGPVPRHAASSLSHLQTRMPNEQIDSMGPVFAQPSRSIDDRRTSAREIFTLYVNRTQNISNWPNTMHALIDEKETHLTEWAIQR